MKKITTAVFPVAGRGTRFLPATKAVPKEMLPIVDKPLVQYAVEEAVAAGATKIVFVTGRYKRAIEDHFDNKQQDDFKICSLDSALRNIHFTNSVDKLNESIHRLKFDEHFFLQILLALRKKKIKMLGYSILHYFCIRKE